MADQTSDNQADKPVNLPELIEHYERGGEKLSLAVRGLTPGDMTCYPVPGTWSIHQIVIHLLDSDLVLADRMKRVIAEDGPTLLAYDETKFAKNLYYHDQSVERAIQILDLNRRLFAPVLRRLRPDAFDRTGNHSERGRVTLRDLLQGAVDHLEHHVKFIHDKRAMMGK